jgi:nucleoside-diphosphate kinase
MKFLQPTKEQLERHYSYLAEKNFYDELLEFLMSGPIVVLVLEGKGVIKAARRMMGATNPQVDINTHVK